MANLILKIKLEVNEKTHCKLCISSTRWQGTVLAYIPAGSSDLSVPLAGEQRGQFCKQLGLSDYCNTIPSPEPGVQPSSWLLPRAAGGWVTLPVPGRQRGGTVAHPQRNLGDEQIESRPDEKHPCF